MYTSCISEDTLRITEPGGYTYIRRFIGRNWLKQLRGLARQVGDPQGRWAGRADWSPRTGAVAASTDGFFSSLE